MDKKYEVKDGVGIIPKGTEYIEENAFNDCKELTSIVIPSSVIEIGDGAFRDCTALTSVVIPKSVRKIGRIAFWRCEGLTEIAVPKSVTEIGDKAFSECTSLASVALSSSMTRIEHHTFEGCTSLVDIKIPKSVTSIGEKAFYGCSSLAEIVIPNSVTVIEDWAFCGCTSLISVTLSKALKTIKACVFRDCVALTNVVIPKSVSAIEPYAFEGCVNLTELVIPDSVKTIGSGILWGAGLPHVEIPAFVTYLDKDCFAGCKNLTSIVVAKKNKVYDSRGNCNAVIQTDKDKLIITCAGTTGIPDTVKSIAPRVFHGHNNLVSIEIPESVNAIGENAFEECTSLETITFKGKVEKMGDDLFQDCENIKAIYVPKGQKAFYKKRILEEYWDLIACPSEKAKKKTAGEVVTERTYRTKRGELTVKVGDMFSCGEMFLDRERYVNRYRFYTDDEDRFRASNRVIAVYEKYVMTIDCREEERGLPEGLKVRLYPNLETDYFTELSPAKFRKQMDFDEYSPSYYALLSPDGGIVEPVEKDLGESEKKKKRTFEIEDETWTEKAVIKELTRQFKKLYPNKKLERFQYWKADLGEYYFWCSTNEDDYVIKINSKTAKVYWDKELG